MNNLEKVEDAALILLGDNPTRSEIEDMVQKVICLHEVNISQQDIINIVKNLEKRFDVSMSPGTSFSSSEHRPWLSDRRGEIDWYYWSRYKRLLYNNKIPPRVITCIDKVTDEILDHLENPKKDGFWKIKGMIVGHVQSGKTANYIGLVNKAADAGYTVIIILAGLLNSLRSQTQVRIDEGFTGFCSDQRIHIGVGAIRRERDPISFTTTKQDFSQKGAGQISARLSSLKEPLVFVVKKNKNTLDDLIRWLEHNNRNSLKDYPMLLIDDEADHASINTNKEDEDSTTINRKIRELLGLFNRSSYLGYTATPFANIFIDPATEDDMLGEEIFPEDFILNLDPPSNYIGPQRIFMDNTNLLRIVDDYNNFIPLKHKKDFVPEELPQSMRDAIYCFILCCAIRIYRQQKDAHNSMLINVSRFTQVQSILHCMIFEFWQEVRDEIDTYYQMSDATYQISGHMLKLKNMCDEEYQDYWGEIKIFLKQAVSRIDVVEINSSSSEKLDYSRKNYPSGRSVIAVGGLSLSRGLTLEGLTVSYFLRNSIMYDTLMQMGRWFGYREGYEDLCRIYMTDEAISWYSHIAEVESELREEFKKMKAAGMSPKEFGLCIRSHPESLIVTARNKMRTGKLIPRKVSLDGRLVETSTVYTLPDKVKSNIDLLDNLVKKIGAPSKQDKGFFWEEVPVEIIKFFISNFENHPRSLYTDKKPLINYIDQLDYHNWQVFIPSPNQTNSKIAGLEIGHRQRKYNQNDDTTRIDFNKRRVGDAQDERNGLSEEIAVSSSGKKYREIRAQQEKPPLLIIHLIEFREYQEVSPIVAYGISFPGESGSRRPEHYVEYIVNTVWWNNEYGLWLDEEDSYE